VTPTVLVVDNYDSFTYNLVHIIAARGHAVVVKRNDEISVDEALDLEPAGILISPGPGRPDSAGISKELIRRAGDIPILGVCLGHQAIGEVFGGRVVEARTLMHGKTSEIMHTGTGVFAGLPQPFTATRYHSLVVERSSVTETLEITATTDHDVVMGLRHRQRPVSGIQFHPESILTVCGPQLVHNWLDEVLSGAVV
jgi:anthranilate synthase component 2